MTRQGTLSSATSITVEGDVDRATAAVFYELYLQTFGELEHKAVARQVLHRDEFMEEMHDNRVHKYVAWDHNREAVAMSTLTSHLETVPWISPNYFAHRYPEHTARGAVYYLGFTLVHPRLRRTRLFQTMIGAVLEVLIANRAVCAYDICSYNDQVLRFGDNIERLLHRRADVTVERVDLQTYYSATFTGRSKNG